MEVLKLWDKTPGTCNEEPVLKYFPAAEKTTKSTVVILPGGGYCFRASGHEGNAFAEYFNYLGMDAFVCEYRVAPHHHFRFLSLTREEQCAMSEQTRKSSE